MQIMKRQNIRTLSLVVVTLTYLIIGAAVFDRMESHNELIQNENLTRYSEKFMRDHSMNMTEFNNLWALILEKKPYLGGNQWKFVGSLYFCTVVVTLIGYGHSTPRTIAGKCFCILYSLIGIPIALIMFQSVGERLNSLISFLLSKLKRKLKLKNQDVGLIDLITVETALTFTITYIASYVFMKNEGWSYFDAIYYCFITLTTIGFGDMVPMQSNSALNASLPYACFTIFFILTGLTTLASSMNLLVLRLATINAEEQVAEKLEAAEAKRQAVHLEGDVISPNGRLLTTQEVPEQCDTISVCSCTCLDHKMWQKGGGKKKQQQQQQQQRRSSAQQKKQNSNSKVKRLVSYNKQFKDIEYNTTTESTTAAVTTNSDKLTSNFCFKSSCGSKVSLPGNKESFSKNVVNNNDDEENEELMSGLQKLKRNSV